MPKHDIWRDGGTRPEPSALMRCLGSFTEWGESPPRWFRWAAASSYVLITIRLWQERGWIVGAMAVLLYAYLVAFICARERTVRWSRNHRFLQGAGFGPSLFVLLGMTGWIALGWCGVAGGAAAVVGGVLGVRKARRERVAA